MRQRTLWTGFAVAALLLLGLLLLPSSSLLQADVIHMNNGQKLEGEIVEETETSVTLKTKFGAEMTLSKQNIASIERTKMSPEGAYQKRAAKLEDSRSAPDWYAFGKWCANNDLEEEATACFEKAISFDSEHVDARKALGHKRHEGRWYTQDEYNREVLELVQWKGRWVTQTEKEMYEAGYRKDEYGNWVEPEADTDPNWQGGRKPKTGGGKSDTSEKKPESGSKDGGAARVIPEEDKAWYGDNEGVSWDQAYVHESKFYRIKTNVKREYAERYGRMLDLYHLKFRQVFQNYLPKTINKSDVHIYKSQQEFMQNTGMGQTTGGFYQTGIRRVTAYHGLFGQNGTTRTVLAHEGTHQFEDLVINFRNCPIWLLEGFAVFFESAYYDREAGKVEIGTIPRDRLANVKRGIQSDSYIRLSELIRTPQASFSGYHYAHAWSVIYYMLYAGSKQKKVGASCRHDQDPEYRSKCKHEQQHNQRVFSSIFMKTKSQRVSAEDVENLFGGEQAFQQFEEEWKQWVADLPYDYDPKADRR